MLSGNGRHRRPRQAPALLVAAGVTGSAIAIPLLGASGASAADGTTWDRVADCETGGAWSQNSGNGYYGGLQLSQEDWENHGGLDYAASADLASRSQQIAVAERILADQGVGAWRTCGLLSGLEQGKDSDSGASGSSDSSGPTDSPGLLDSLGSSPSASPSSSPSSSDTPSDTSSDTEDEKTKSDKSSESADSASRDQGSGGSPSATPESGEAGNARQGDESSALTDTGSGRHRGPSADESLPSDSGRADESTGRHASGGDEGSEEGSGDAVQGDYIVGVGDSLWSIADSLDVSGGWHALYVGNEKAVGTDPNLIQPGQKLTVEGEGDEK
ncbi:LysM domain-containing protein [Streptomyces sp. Ag82_O1-12]|uniref:LysM peptidoglycan-binding domain-containing protein n=1 Tax=unclassified Streptomyces TaxID=2593676 RepID=UPI000BD2B785|nr:MULTISPECIES: transglycosylase family protein [unclassified Streptomyces]SMQ16810.1 LysM domain-containing protein [Streptomyces sp. Ag82_O1-12]SOD45838.1 LysM domain-containing protein [Streptomyces sp. Ag82_G6-1]